MKLGKGKALAVLFRVRVRLVVLARAGFGRYLMGALVMLVGVVILNTIILTELLLSSARSGLHSDALIDRSHYCRSCL